MSLDLPIEDWPFDELDRWLSQQHIFMSAHTMPGYEGPFEALKQFLLASSVGSLECIEHPLFGRTSQSTLRETWNNGVSVKSSASRRWLKPPLSYLTALNFRPSIPPTIWIAFDPMTIAQAVLQKPQGAVAVGWHVDFVPDRGNRIINSAYRRIDRFGHNRVDIEVDLSEEASRARQKLHHKPALRPVVAPMGIWKTQTELEGERLANRRVIYVGALEARTTSGMLPELIRATHQLDPTISFDIVGEGPESTSIEKALNECGNGILHGFLSSERVNVLMNEAALGLAPYEDSPDTFSRYADPGKIKNYLGAGLPILLSPVPPNSTELEENNVAILIDSSLSAREWSEEIESLLSDEDSWLGMSSDVSRYAERFFWPEIFKKVVETVHSLK